MARVIKDRGASGHGSIMFRQDLAYPRVPEQITYYPPEPSEELRKQVAKDKAGGIALYIIGFFTAIIGLAAALSYSDAIDVYSLLIPFLLVMGLVCAILYLILNNVTLAKLSRTLPLILMVCLLILYIVSIIMAVVDLGEMMDTEDEDAMSDAFDSLFSTILNPAFFFLTAGLVMARAGGMMLWTSTRVVHEYIPGMIILEVPGFKPRGEPAEVTGVGATCEHCGGPLSYIEEYGRWYCYDCGEYSETDEED